MPRSEDERLVALEARCACDDPLFARAMSIGPEELPDSASIDHEIPPGAPEPQRDAFAWTVAMISRLDFAAVYLGLLTRARPPIDSPDGLGRPGRSAVHSPSPGGRSAWSERETGSWS